MKNKKWSFGIGIGVCILLLGMMCIVIQNFGKSRGEEADFADQFTNSEEEKMYNYMEKQLALILERTGMVWDCEVDISYSESEIVGADIKITAPEGSIGNDNLRTDIAEAISKALNISTESITVSAD